MKISVIIPCYNQGQYLEECCNSVINQTYDNWEAIIIDDGSSDNTAEIANKICSKETRFTYFFQKNKGLSAARNSGLKQASGDYIQFLDSDDYLHLEKFRETINYLEKGNQLVISDFNMFSENIYNIEPAYCDLSKVNFKLKSLIKDWDITYTIPIHCAVFSKLLTEDIFFDEDLKAKEDWLFWIEIFKQTPSVYYLNKKYAFYRTHEKSLTKDLKLMKEFETKAIHKVLNKLDDSYNKVFLNRIIEELGEEKSKGKYLFSLKKSNEEKIDKLEVEFKELNVEFKELNVEFKELDIEFKELNVEFKELNAEFKELDVEFKELDVEFKELNIQKNNFEQKLLRIKKSIFYKTLVKLELFVRNIKKITI